MRLITLAIIMIILTIAGIVALDDEMNRAIKEHPVLESQY